MKTKIEQSSATNPNPVLSVAKDCTVLYSNMAGKPILQEWGVRSRRKTAFEYRRYCAEGNFP